MDEKTTKLIKERFDALPDSIKEVILSSHYEESLIEIGKQYNLNVEQLGIVERETTLTMMGLTPVRDFEAELTREIKIDALKGSQIVKDINEKIFLKIRDLLKLMNTPTGVEPLIEETHQTSTQILNSAGIEIIDKAPVSSTVFLAKPVSISTNSMLEQKMIKPFQIPMVQTEHSLENISKPSTTVPQAPKVYPKGNDPYRLPPI